MDVMALLNKIVVRMDMLYTAAGCDEQKALLNTEYALLKKTAENLSEGIRKVEKAKIINNSYMCIHDPRESENIIDYIDVGLVEQAKQLCAGDYIWKSIN